MKYTSVKIMWSIKIGSHSFYVSTVNFWVKYTKPTDNVSIVSDKGIMPLVTTVTTVNNIDPPEKLVDPRI